MADSGVRPRPHAVGHLSAPGSPATAPHRQSPPDGARDRRPGRGSRRGEPRMTQSILEVDDLSLKFGGLVALDGVSFEIRQGEILGLIGPNGAGKTTCFNAITGVYSPTSGEIRFQGKSLAGRKRFEITQ